MSIFEGQIISYKAFDDIYEGIVLEIRNNKIYTLDIYGNLKTIINEDIIVLTSILKLDIDKYFNPCVISSKP